MQHRFKQTRPDIAHRIVLTFAVSLITPWLALSTAHANDQKPKPLPIEQMRATVYTKEFAKRFALPEPQPGTEPEGGVQAMEFAVEDAKAKYPHKRFATYQCVLKLYLDNTLPIAYPEEGVSGDHRRFIAPMHFFLRPDADNKQRRLTEKDSQHFHERNGRYNRMTMLASPDYDHPEFLKEPPKKHYGAIGMFYEEYHRDLFPGLAYLKIDMGCPAYSWVDKIDTAQIWLKREGGKDYRKLLRMEPQDFLKITMPPKFYHQIIQWTKQTAAYNRPLMEEEQRKTKSTKERQ